MKNAELKYIAYGADVANKSEAYLHMLRDEVCFSIALAIGEEGSEGADYFDVEIYNLNWIKKHKYALGKFSIVVDTDDFDDVIEYLRIEIAQIQGNNWDEISNKLRKMFAWEYDDYIFNEDEKKKIAIEYIQKHPMLIMKEILCKTK